MYARCPVDRCLVARRNIGDAPFVYVPQVRQCDDPLLHQLPQELHGGALGDVAVGLELRRVDTVAVERLDVPLARHRRCRWCGDHSRVWEAGRGHSRGCGEGGRGCAAGRGVGGGLEATEEVLSRGLAPHGRSGGFDYDGRHGHNRVEGSHGEDPLECVETSPAGGSDGMRSG